MHFATFVHEVSTGFAAVVMMLLDFAGDGGASSDGGASCDGGVSNDGGASSDGGACFHSAERWAASAPSPHVPIGRVLASLMTLGSIGRCSFSHLLSLDQMV